MVSIKFHAIPDELKERDQWLLWDSDNETPRRPHWNGDFAVAWNDPAAWHSFDEARELAERVESWGIGYVTAANNTDYVEGAYAVIDIDGAFDDDGELRDWVPKFDLFADARTYAEMSPSGNGVHIPIDGSKIPEWWSDIEVSPDLHQGVDVLANKFCTFTGDTVPQTGDSIAPVDPTPWLLKAHKNITGESPFDDRDTIDSQSARDRLPDDEWLTDTKLEDLLTHIDPDQSYDQWLRVLFAIHDYDSSGKGKQIAKQWSKRGTKWDADAIRTLDWVWNNADSGSAVTIKTAVYKAKEGGWSPKSAGSTGPTEEQPHPPDAKKTDDHSPESGRGSDDVLEWEFVRGQYDDGDTSVGRFYAAEALEDRHHWMYVVESETLWIYDAGDGYYHPWGEQRAARILERELYENYSKRDREEVIERLCARNQTHRKEINARSMDGYYLCVGNGVVNLETGELEDHDPDFNFTRGLEWDYDPDRADREPVLSFLDDITKRKADRETLLDHLAHGLMPGHPFRAFVITYGPGSNGKTQMGKLFRGFVGEENAASVELQDLTGDDSFATGGLPGAFVNVGDDVSVSEIRDVSILKSLTGAGTIRANEKYEKQYEFENEAAMFFSANEPPRIAEESAAIGDRLYPIEMPYRFVSDNEYDEENDLHKRKTPGIAKQLLNDDAAMRGLLSLCVEHAQQLIGSDGQYSMLEGPQERRELYEAASDPIRRFAIEYLEPAPKDSVLLKQDVYDVYTAMCSRENERIASEQVFKRQLSRLSRVLDIESTRTRRLAPGDEREPAWRYVSFDDRAAECMPPRLQERYFESTSQDAAQDAQPTEEDGEKNEVRETNYAAEPLSVAGESATGYVTVTAEVTTTDTLGEDASGLKAVLTDETGAMDIIAWEEQWRERLKSYEAETVVIKNAEIYTSDYDDTRKLTPVDGLTEIDTIQQGVGHTDPIDTDQSQSSLGGTAETFESEDLPELESPQQMIESAIEIVNQEGGEIERPKLLYELDMEPSKAKAVVEKGLERGQLIRTPGGKLCAE